MRANEPDARQVTYGGGIRVKIEEAAKRAERNGHHLESAHDPFAMRWACVVCRMDLWVMRASGDIGGTAIKGKCSIMPKEK